MKKQIHIRLDEDLYNILKTDAVEQEMTFQDYIQNTLFHYYSSDTKFSRNNKSNQLFTFIDLFAGIGGMRLAFEAIGGECVFSSEINKYAQATYFANFNEIPDGDITKINENDVPDHDILVAGFPCQPFSIAGVSKKNSMGKKHGFLDKSQGTLFFDILRIIKHKRPRAFFLENVKNLITHDKGNTFNVIKAALEDANYELYTKIIDGKYFVPQHRERIYIIGLNKEIYRKNIMLQFPTLTDRSLSKVRNILDKKVDDKYELSDKLWQDLQNYAEKHKQKGNGFGFGLVNLDGITRTLSARYYKDGSEILIPQKNKNPRRLTPRECARLQGFPDTFKIVVSDTQAYKQFGNSVVVPLIKALAEELIRAMRINSLNKNDINKEYIMPKLVDNLNL